MHQTASTTIIRTNKCFLVAQKKDALCLSNLSEQIARQWCAWTTLVGDTGSNSSCRHREGKKTQCGTSVLWQWKSTQEKIRLFCFKHVKPIHLLKKKNGFCWRKPKPCLPAEKITKNSLSHWVKDAFTSSTLCSMGPCTWPNPIESGNQTWSHLEP